MALDSENLLGELEDFLNNIPSGQGTLTTKDTFQSGPTAIGSISPKPTATTGMTAATKAALGEHLRNNMGGGGEKRKLDDSGGPGYHLDSSSQPKSQRLDADEDLSSLFDAPPVNINGGNNNNNVSLMPRDDMNQQLSPGPPRKTQGNILEQVLKEKRTPRSHLQQQSQQMETFARRNLVDNGGNKMMSYNQEELFVINNKINEIFRNPTLDSDKRKAQLQRLVKEHPKASKILMQLKAKAGGMAQHHQLESRDMGGLDGQVNNNCGRPFNDNNMVQQPTFNNGNGNNFNGGGMTGFAGQALDDGMVNYDSSPGNWNGSNVQTQVPQQQQLRSQSFPARSPGSYQQFQMQNNMNNGNVFNGNGMMEPNSWNTNDPQFVGGGSFNQGPPPNYPYAARATNLRMRNGGMVQQMGPANNMGYTMQQQNEFQPGPPMASPGSIRYGPRMPPAGMGGDFPQRTMLPSQGGMGMRASMYNGEVPGMFSPGMDNGLQQVKTRPTGNPRMTNLLRAPPAQTNVNMPMYNNAMANGAMNMPNGGGTNNFAMSNNFVYQQQQQMTDISNQYSSNDGAMQRLSGGNAFPAYESNFSNNEGLNNGRTLQQQQFEFDEEMQRVARENSGFSGSNDLALSNWKTTPDGQNCRNQIRQKLQEAVPHTNQVLVTEAIKMEEDVYNSSDTKETYTFKIAEWLAGVFQRIGASENKNNTNTSKVLENNDSENESKVDQVTGPASNMSNNVMSPTTVTNSNSSTSLSEKNPLLTTQINQANENQQPLSAASVDSVVSSCASPVSSSSPSCMTSLVSSTNSVNSRTSTENNNTGNGFPNPNNFSIPNTFEETRSPLSNSSGLQKGGRRHSGKNQVTTHPCSVDSGIESSPKSNMSTSHHGTSPNVSVNSENSPEK